MASFYRKKGSPYYWMRVKRADGTWADVSSGVRADALGAVRKIEQKVAEETAREARMSQESRALMRLWVPGWLGYHYVNGKSRARAMNAWAHLSAFFALRRVHHPEEVTYRLCHEFMAWRTDAEACKREGRRVGNWNTALTELRILGTIMQEALSQGWIVSNPCSRLRLGRKDVKEKRAIERDEEARIEEALKSAPQWMQDCWLVGIKQGCRLAEVRVRMADISERQMVIPFRVKGGKIHPAPLHRDLLPLIARRREEGAEFLVDLSPSPSKDWVNFFNRLGMPGLSFHCLRVTVITRLALADVTAEKAMQYVGHCSEMVHAIYRKLRPKDVASLGDFL